MQCPIDTNNLVMTDRQGIVIIMTVAIITTKSIKNRTFWATFLTFNDYRNVY